MELPTLETMMRPWIGVLAIGLAGVAGCSDRSHKPVSISGTVKTASGKPVTGVRLIVAPAEASPMSPIGSFGFELDSEGHFEGKATPGTYIFYLSTVAVERDDDDGHPVNATEAKKLKASQQALKAIPAAYHSPKGAGPDRKVEVKTGESLSLVISH